ncbi:MAG: phosphatase PAP2 family protein [Chloroflexota bacterium]
MPVDDWLMARLPAAPVPLALRAMNRLASAPVWTGVVLTMAILLAWRTTFRTGLWLLLADVTAEIASVLAKLLVARRVLRFEDADEPLSWWDTLTASFLFPSGHVVRVLVVTGLVVVLLGRSSLRLRFALAAACGGFVLVLGWARVAVHAHLPTDVLGGYLLGGAWISLALLARWWFEREHMGRHSACAIGAQSAVRRPKLQ